MFQVVRTTQRILSRMRGFHSGLNFHFFEIVTKDLVKLKNLNKNFQLFLDHLLNAKNENLRVK
jgi:hypothetical protein